MTANVDSQLILVCFVLRSVDQIEVLAEAIATATGLTVTEVIVLDNAAALPPGRHLRNGRRIEVAHGDNRWWEFGGLIEGLDRAAASDGPPLVILLNDSFLRNWTASAASRLALRRMVRAARQGCVAGWQDSLSDWRTLHPARRPNSRIVILGRERMGELRRSIRQAIDALRERLASRQPLFTPVEKRVLDRFSARHSGRWTAEQLGFREQRIFIEHKMFDALPSRTVRLFPRTWPGSLLYSLARRLLREQR